MLVYPPAAPRRFLGDAERLDQMLSNLLSNAVKFTDRGEIVLGVSVRTQRQETLVRLAVSDSGPGIPDSQLKSVFETFTQLDPSPTRRHGGTGLGLAICRQLAELFGGSVGVESEETKGSTFWVELPLALDQRQPSRSEDDGALTGRTALVIDACGARRAWTVEALADLGTTAVGADSVEAARQVLEEDRGRAQPLDLVLADSVLPGVRGLLASLRSRPSAPPRVLLLTSDAGASPAGPAAGEQEAAFDASRVLLVEDNPVNRMVTERMLALLGCQVELALDGVEALEKLEARSFNAILMDCQLPRMDGLEATVEVRRRERAEGREQVPIIALTAHALPEELERCTASGMDDVLVKPVQFEGLRSVLARWLSAGGAS